MPKKKQVSINVISGKDLSGCTCCEIKFKDYILKTKPVKKQNNPTWDQTFDLGNYSSEDIIYLSCLTKSKKSTGACQIKMSDYNKEGVYEEDLKLEDNEGTICIKLTVYSNNKNLKDGPANSDSSEKKKKNLLNMLKNRFWRKKSKTESQEEEEEEILSSSNNEEEVEEDGESSYEWETITDQSESDEWETVTETESSEYETETETEYETEDETETETEYTDTDTEEVVETPKKPVINWGAIQTKKRTKVEILTKINLPGQGGLFGRDLEEIMDDQKLENPDLKIPHFLFVCNNCLRKKWT
eukprot:TRINITY_DN1204_c0_g3_i1.p1 TRINITY_DN1204_c0_g3~~TRINITY_DN1204_c0_g3_i1.p1  ORF type:complete len:301 (-),score=116.54 TRINITY_DN1204_c0_g3_i1:588-1490(-)